MFVFQDIELQQKPVQIGNDWYLLEEPSGGAAVAWRNGCAAAARIGIDGRAERVDSIADIEPKLIADCLFYATVKKGVEEVKVAGDLEKGERVSLSVVLGWTHKIYPQMYAWLMKVGELSDMFKKNEDKEAAKDDQEKEQPEGN